MAKPNSIATRRRRKAGEMQAFMGRLLAPLPEAELHDPALARIEAKALRKNWEIGMFRFSAADRLYEYYDFTGCVRTRTGMTLKEWAASDMGAAKAAALTARCDEMRRQILVPAPDTLALEWKRKRMGLGGLTPAHFAAVAADEAWLAARAAKAKRG